MQRDDQGLGPTGVSFEPLGYTKEKQIAFCQKRIAEQNEYIEDLRYRRPYNRKLELKESAKEVRTRFEEKLKELTS